MTAKLRAFELIALVNAELSLSGFGLFMFGDVVIRIGCSGELGTKPRASPGVLRTTARKSDVFMA